MDIRCRKQKCKYNDHFTCKAKNICVSKNAICIRYEEDVDKDIIDTSKDIFNRTPIYSPQRDSKTIKIACQAKCLLNKDGQCIANGITINDYRKKPYCMTFIVK